MKLNELQKKLLAAAKAENCKRARDQIRALDRRGTGLLSEDFQLDLLERGTVAWKCRAGARFFTVCEDGLVHLCTPKMGLGAKPRHDIGIFAFGTDSEIKAGINSASLPSDPFLQKEKRGDLGIWPR